jgi:hypothetical protein
MSGSDRRTRAGGKSRRTPPPSLSKLGRGSRSGSISSSVGERCRQS